MRLWRVSTHEGLDGAGGLRSAGRWHSRGRPVVYASLSPAAALLEIVVELGVEAVARRHRLLLIEAPAGLEAEAVLPEDLPSGWKRRPELTRARGDAWLAAGRTALLRVPSSIVPETNILINPRHPEARRLRLDGIETVDFSQPLF